jgi:hypothetical protein
VAVTVVVVVVVIEDSYSKEHNNLLQTFDQPKSPP